MLFLETKFMVSKIIRKEGTIEIHFADGRDPFYFRVKPDRVIFYREDSDTEIPFTNDIFIKTYGEGGYILNSRILNNIDISALTDDMVNTKYYMIPLTKEDSAVRSIKNKNRLKEYETILSKNYLIMCPENFEIGYERSADNNTSYIKIRAQKLTSDKCMDINITKSPLPSYVQVKYEEKNNRIEYKNSIINRLPVTDISYTPLVYIESYDIIADTSVDTEYLAECGEKDIDFKTAVEMITDELQRKKDMIDEIEEDFGMKSEKQVEAQEIKTEPSIPIPQLANKWMNWTQNVMMYIDNSDQVKVHQYGNWASIEFDFADPVQVLCKTIKTDIRMAESYALDLFNINQISMCYDFANDLYTFAIRDTLGQIINYSQLPYIPIENMDEEYADQIYITFANRCVIIDDRPYLDCNDEVLAYVNARSYLA